MYGNIGMNFNNLMQFPALNNPFWPGASSCAAYPPNFMSSFYNEGDIPSMLLSGGMNFGHYSNYMMPMSLYGMVPSVNLNALPICPSIFDAYGSFAGGAGMFSSPFLSMTNNSGFQFQFTVPTIPTLATGSSSIVANVSSPNVATASKSSSPPLRTMKLGKDLSPEFINKVKRIAANLRCDYQDLLSVMNSESGLNPQAQSKSGGAVGLIQFTNIAIKELNQVYGLSLTKDKIKNMSAIEQLDIVEKLIMLTKKRKFSPSAQLSGADLYALIYLPARATNQTLATRGENYYEANRGLDLDGDGRITKDDLARRVQQKRVSIVA